MERRKLFFIIFDCFTAERFQSVKTSLLFMFAFSTFTICERRPFCPLSVKVWNQGKEGAIPWGFIDLSVSFLTDVIP